MDLSRLTAQIFRARAEAHQMQGMTYVSHIPLVGRSTRLILGRVTGMRRRENRQDAILLRFLIHSLAAAVTLERFPKAQL